MNTLTLNAEFARGGDVLGWNDKRVGGSIFCADVLQQQFVNLFVNHNVHAVRGRHGLTVLHPGALNVFLGEPDLQLSNVPLTHRQVSQGKHQCHWAH